MKSAVKLSLSKTYVDSLGDNSDGKLTAAELQADPEGAALLASLQSQIAANLGLSKSSIEIQDIVTGRRNLLQSLHSVVDTDTYETSDNQGTSIPVMSGEDYYTVPSSAELAAMPPSSLRAVKNFRVGRVGYGEVRWLGETDITGVDLNAAVSINRGEVSVYKGVAKPSVDSKLNKPAVIVLERVLPPAGVRAERFGGELKKALTKAGAMPIAYQVPTGQWTFAVPNFMET